MERPKFKHNDGLEFEPVESPEYIAFCEENHYGYTMGVNIAMSIYLHKCFEPERFFCMNVLPEFESLPKPYVDAIADGTYKTAHQKYNDFLNSMESTILFPKGMIRETDKHSPPISYFNNAKNIKFLTGPSYKRDNEVWSKNPKGEYKVGIDPYDNTSTGISKGAYVIKRKRKIDWHIVWLIAYAIAALIIIYASMKKA